MGIAELDTETTLEKEVSRRFMLECGNNSIDRLGWNIPLTEIVAYIEKMLSDVGVDAEIDLVMYDGMNSEFMGARVTNPPFNTAQIYFDALNTHGFPFYIAINGGLTLPDKLDRDFILDEVSQLIVLQESGIKYDVRNGVIVTRHDVAEVIREEFPDLSLVASCIYQLDPRNPGYEGAFQLFDYVVPMNPHTTYDFLSQFRQYVEQMLVFLNFDCVGPNMYECYKHYARVEMDNRNPEGHERVEVRPKSDFKAAPCQLPSYENRTPCCGSNYRSEDAELINRPVDLIRLIEMGVTKFKVPRSYHLYRHVVEKLVDCIAEATHSQDPAGHYSP
jgi:hypothetical protein